MEVPCADVLFGNFIHKHTFLAHYKVDQQATDNWYGTIKDMQYYYTKRLNAPPELDPDCTIYTDFEHDHSKMTIVFPMQRLQSRTKGDKSPGASESQNPDLKWVPSVCKLEIPYGAIRRVFCKVCTLKLFWNSSFASHLCVLDS